MPDRRALIGSRFELADLQVDANDSAAYAKAIADDDPTRHQGRDTASPFYAVALVAPLWRSVYQMSELGTEDQKVLHAEQRMLVHRDLRVGESLTGQAEVTDVVGFGFNDAAIIRCRLLDDRGAPVVSMESTLAVQGSSGYPPAPRCGANPTRGGVAAQLGYRFGEDITARYADAADDHNPLHLDDEVAKAAGHVSRIVHGMCTLATGVSALVNELGKRSNVRLSYVRARFSRPVLPGDTIVYTAYHTRADKTYLVGASLGRRPVLKSCWIRLADAA